MKNEIVSYPENYLGITFKAGRNCYGTKIDISEEYDVDKAAAFARMLVSKAHGSVLEHVNVGIYITDVSRSFLAQLTRHRLVSYSVKSQHFVRHLNFKYKELEDYGKHPITNKVKYDLLMKRINEVYGELIGDGVPHYIAREVLPNACCTDIFMTANVREWRWILKLRATKNNTPEIMAWARDLIEQFSEAMPELFEDLKTEENGFP